MCEELCAEILKGFISDECCEAFCWVTCYPIISDCLTALCDCCVKECKKHCKDGDSARKKLVSSDGIPGSPSMGRYDETPVATEAEKVNPYSIGPH